MSLEKTGIATELQPESNKILFSLARLKPEQVSPMFEQAGSVLITNALVTVFVAIIFRNDPSAHLALSWVAASLTFTAISYVAVKRTARLPVSEFDHVQRAKFMLLLSGLRGAFWGAGLAMLLPMASIENQLILGWMVGGIMCGGAFAYWTVPSAALCFTTIVTLGGSVGMTLIPNFGGAPAVLPTIALMFMLMRVILWNVQFLRQGIADKEKLHSKNEVIGLLLRDFEDKTTDWLWEMDGDGKLVRGIGPFARLIDIEDDIFSETAFITICEASTKTETQVTDVAVLRKTLEDRQAFGERLVTFCNGKHPVHIELSAKPIINGLGKFIGWRGAASDKTLVRQSELEIYNLAHYDSLTGLPNRVHFYDVLNATLRSAEQKLNWVLYLDLDGFKAVNDTYGHAMGDLLLKAVASRVRNVLTKQDIFARLSGDEFAMIIEGNSSEVEAKWRAIIELFRDPFDIAHLSLSIGTSIGIAQLKFKDISADEILRRADLALYQAKHSGRGGAQYYDCNMDQRLLERRLLGRDLKMALQLDQFLLHFQPIVALESGAVCAYEALVWWQHPRLGFIGPDKFISVAEEWGLIAELGDWVLQAACKEAAGWDHHIKVAVNVSPLQLRSSAILASVTRALSQSGLRPSRLELEITESALIEDATRVEKLCKDLKVLGVSLALDDFGTGYSSLSHLHQFSFDKIKIDRSFVQSFAERKESAAVIRAVMLLAKALNLETTAEGIETEEQLQAMTAVGCGQGQGFLFGRPSAVLVDADSLQVQQV